MPLQSDAEIAALLRATRSIAVIGIKDAPDADAFRVPAYLQAHGYRIEPVNPKLERVLGVRAVGSLRELSEVPDLVNVFRALRHVPAHVDEILALPHRPRAVWLQLGIRHDGCARRLEAAGVAVVQDRCLMIEHRRMLGSTRDAGADQPPPEAGGRSSSRAR